MRTETAGTRTVADFAPSAADFRAEFVAGLKRRPRRLPCKFFYDERGSALFDRICELPEYYPTRTELGILEQNAAAIAGFCGPECLLVELGSGSSRKTRVLLDELETPAGYVPVDISRTHLHEAATRLAIEYPGLEIMPVCADYAQSLRLPSGEAGCRRKVIFFPGSTIGNFEPEEASAFLRRIATWCEPGDRLVVGVDLAKPREQVEPAYNDSQGVTAAFNLNLLRRANAELGANFRLEAFSHRAVYNAGKGRIEMHLISDERQSVEIDDERFTIGKGERIVTEFSYKYRRGQFDRIAAAANWKVVTRWSDEREWFGVFAFELQAGRRA